MSQANVPAWEVGHYASVFCNAAAGSNLGLVADGAFDRGAKVPANGANTTVVNFKGITRKSVAAGAKGDVALHPGDIAVAFANGAIAAGATVFLTSADAGKEGMLKSYTSFGADGVVFIVGVAETPAADGEIFEVRLQGLYLKTA